jgi:ornithine carbamoyltransferase
METGGTGAVVPTKRGPKDLLRTIDLGPENLRFLLEASARFKREPYSEGTCLRGDTVVIHFTKFSTRTRLSFETAIAHLGGIPLSVGPHDLQLDRGETIEDTARVISGYARAYVTRTYRDDDVWRFARAATIPVINALTDGHHPCQSVADLLTLVECWPSLTGRRVAYVGDGTNVAHSLIEGCALLGIDIAVASPPGYAPDPSIVDDARRVGQASGSAVVVTDDPTEAVRAADAVYTDVWTSMGMAEADQDVRLRSLRPYQVNVDLLQRAQPDAIFLHCLPAHRGEEVTAEVIDGPRSRVFQQAFNRLPTAQAILWALVTGALRPVGRASSS